MNTEHSKETDPGLAVLPVAARGSAAARQRLLHLPGEPLFYANWNEVLFIHFEADPERLQAGVRFPLDLYAGKAFVSIVLFTMSGLRPRRGGKLAAWLFRPIVGHDFCNLRTYVRWNDEPGILFLAEWIPNRLSVCLGPITYGLPYRYARTQYRHDARDGILGGRIFDGGAALVCRAQLEPPVRLTPSVPGTVDDFLLERYTAYTDANGRRRFFRIWHEPWRQTPVNVEIIEDGLLRRNFPWFASFRCAGAHYSPGVRDVWMGRPHRT